MDFWDIFELFAWAVSAILFMWMLTDAVRVNREFNEDLLLSSREGIDELLEHGDGPGAAGGGRG
jgi:hypothetical protein